MNLLKSINKSADVKKRIVREDATTTGDVAGTRGLIFNAPSSIIRRLTNDFTKDYNSQAGKKKKKGLGLKEAFTTISEGGVDDFDQSEVISRLKALEDREKTDMRDTVTFGIEDDNGQVVRVTVRNEQAEDFERALQAVMGSMEEEESSKTEIAEMLYKLKDQFDIVDVVWPEIEEDEEEVQPEFNDEQGEPGMEGEPNENGGEGLGDLDNMDSDDGLSGGSDDEVKSLLSQVIDMMTADAAARKADAEARIADAKAREQELGAKQALAKIKQEEQFLDMEDFQKKQKESEKEAKRLAQLAKWKSEMGQNGDVDATMDDGPDMGLPQKQGPVGGFEDEEVRRVANPVAPSDLARRLIGGR
jgi:hypothetical protein